MSRNGYIVTGLNMYGRGVTDENTIICDEASLVTAINTLINKDDKNKDSSVVVRKCGLMMNEKDSDQYRMGAWGKTSGE